MGPSIETLKLLCNYDGTRYVSKEGQDYIDALSSVFELDNRNDNPFLIEDIVQQPLLSQFSFPRSTRLYLYLQIKSSTYGYRK